METIIVKITGDLEQDQLKVQQAAKIIKNGGLVAFPTETVYGLGGDAMDRGAAEKIYEAKGRPSDNPLIVHIAEIKDMEQLSSNVPEVAYKLAEKFWPGPLTMILNKSEQVPITVTGGLDTVAIRLPSHQVARNLIIESGTFIAAPSANISGRPSPTEAQHVIGDLSGRVDMIIDDGSIDIGVESTIVDLTEAIPVVLRPGYITLEMLKQVVGNVILDKAFLTETKIDVKPKAPGMKYRHYAPDSELIIIEGDKKAVINKIKQLTKEAQKKGQKVGIMVETEHVSQFTDGEIIGVGSEQDNLEIARNLFAALRKFNELKVDIIYSEAFSEEGIGQAVMNRLLKAAGHKILKV